MSANRVCDEMQACQDMGIKEIMFYDDTFTISKKRVFDICDEYNRRRLTVKWDIRSRVDTVTEPMLREMQDAGCREIIYGIESASPIVLDAIQKNITPEQMEMAVTTTKDLGIRVSLFFMFGNPGDTLESIRETSKLARRLNPNFASFNIAPVKSPSTNQAR